MDFEQNTFPLLEGLRSASCPSSEGLVQHDVILWCFPWQSRDQNAILLARDSAMKRTREAARASVVAANPSRQEKKNNRYRSKDNVKKHKNSCWVSIILGRYYLPLF